MEGLSLRAVPFGPGGGDVVPILSARQRAQLSTIATKLHLPPRMAIYHEGANAQSIFILGNGVVKSFRDLPSGKRRIMSFLFSQDVFGLARSGSYVNSTQATTPVTLYRLNLVSLTAALRQDADLEFQFLCKLTHALRESMQHNIIMGRRDAVGRLAMFLRMLEENTIQRDSEIEVPMSRSDVANYLGLSLEAVSRASRALQRSCIAAFEGRHKVRVLDRARFEQLSSAT